MAVHKRIQKPEQKCFEQRDAYAEETMLSVSILLYIFPCGNNVCRLCGREGQKEVFMCGIYGVMNIDHAQKKILEGLRKLEYRGYDSWGIAVGQNKRVIVEKHAGRVGTSVSLLPDSSFGIGHTRWATHGGVTDANAHPHTDCTGRLALIHNGIVENFAELRKSLRKHRIVSETDTEIVAHLIEEEMKARSFVEAVQAAFRRLKGLNALVVLDSTTAQIVAVKNGSPLVLGKKRKAWILSSDLSSLGGSASSVKVLEDGEVVVIGKRGVQVKSIAESKWKAPKMKKHAAYAKHLRLGKYRHFLQKEIAEQPEVLLRILRTKQHTCNVLVEEVKKKGSVMFSGCGTASYAALVGEYLFSKAGIPSRSVQGNEFSHTLPALSTSTLPIFLSQSGETADIIEPLRELKKKGIATASLVNVASSTLDRMSDISVRLLAGPEVSVASTKAFTAMVATLYLLAHAVVGSEDRARRVLSEVSKAMARMCSPVYGEKHILPVARKLAESGHLYILGRGSMYPIALEAALKIKETTYMHAEGFSGGELKHGMIALIERGSPCIVLAPDDETYDEMVSNAMEVKARGGFIIGITSRRDSVFDAVIPVEMFGDATLFTATVAVQLLAYHIAVLRGNDVDKPRNLAKSVTVK